MTAPSRDGRDKPFCDWLRNHPELDSYTARLYSSDVDQIFCKYKTHVDGCGTRQVKLILEVEVKCFGAVPSPEQSEILFFRHQLLQRKGKILSNLSGKKNTVWHFGQFILQICGGERPDNCNSIAWGVFDSIGRISYHPIREEQLLKILSFVVYPHQYEPLTLRRHHKTTEITYLEYRNLLFPMERVLKVKS